jgi:hypothetical protein
MHTIRTDFLQKPSIILFAQFNFVFQPGYSIIIHVVNINKLLIFQNFVAKQWLLCQKDPSYPTPSSQF